MPYVLMSRSSMWVGDQEVLATADRALNQMLKSVARTLDAGEARQAIRILDRACRTMTQHRAILMPVLGHLLLRYGQDPDLALAALTRAAQLQASADIEADRIHCWLQLGQVEAARRCLASAVMAYACAPDAALAQAAQALLASSSSFPGFVLLTPDLKLCAQSRSRKGGWFELRGTDGTVLIRSKGRVSKDGRSTAMLGVPQIDQPQFVVVTADEQSLVGGERILPIDFRVEGRSTAHDGFAEGWLRLGWNPSTPVDFEVSDEKGRSRRLRATQRDPDSHWHYRFRPQSLGLGNRLRIDVLLPDGTRRELDDSPLLLKPELDAQLRRITPRSRSRTDIAWSSRPSEQPTRAVDVIVPVYQGHAETLACIDAIRRTTKDIAASIIVVDDASPDAALSADLDTLAAQGKITLLRNPINLGFAGSVNRAMSEHEVHDAVLVNSDVVVFGDWLERLQQAACSNPNIGSVTPFSDDDSVAGYGDSRSGHRSAYFAEILDQFAKTICRHVRVELPVGVGFCLYLRRDCWRDVGIFDAEAFSKGYGEESDWCMRARKRGWQHILAADVFVHHAGGVSFGHRRQALQERAQRLMNLRHVGYDRYVQRFLTLDPLHPLRRGFDRHRLATQGRPIVLLLSLAYPGGVDRFVSERCQWLRARGKLPLLLRPLEIGPEACMLWSGDLLLTQLRFTVPDELNTLSELLKALPIESIELHHFLGLDARLIQVVLKLGKPFDAYLHDYSWVCPRITLMDETRRYCGEPAVRVCEQCIQRNGSELMESITVANLRRRSRRWLQAARRVIAPSHDTANRYRRYLPEADIAVEPLEAAPRAPVSGFRGRTGPVRVALIGAIGEHKGYSILLACARDAIARELDLEFVVIGYTGNDTQLMKTGRVFVTGQYTDDEVRVLVSQLQPDLIWLPSVWPETWCYTLTHAMSQALPVVAFDIGAVAERLRDWGSGKLLALDLSPSEINDQLLKCAADGAVGEASLFN